jgi:uncharacterized protein YlxP (DUF503 family)
MAPIPFDIRAVVWLTGTRWCELAGFLAIFDMNIGALRVRLRIPENHSLKGKRMVLRSVTSRVKNKFNVSIAEIDDQDMWQVATLGITCVSNDSRHVNETLSHVMNFIEANRGDAEVLDYEIELLNAL